MMVFKDGVKSNNHVLNVVFDGGEPDTNRLRGVLHPVSLRRRIVERPGRDLGLLAQALCIACAFRAISAIVVANSSAGLTNHQTPVGSWPIRQYPLVPWMAFSVATFGAVVGAVVSCGTGRAAVAVSIPPATTGSASPE